jgi:hypothetical protein
MLLYFKRKKEHPRGENADPKHMATSCESMERQGGYACTTWRVEGQRGETTDAVALLQAARESRAAAAARRRRVGDEERSPRMAAGGWVWWRARADFCCAWREGLGGARPIHSTIQMGRPAQAQPKEHSRLSLKPQPAVSYHAK